MRLRHDMLNQLVHAAAGAPVDAVTRRHSFLQLGLNGLLLAQAVTAHSRERLVGGLGLSAGVIALSVLCALTVWRSRPAYAQLMRPVSVLHLLLCLLHAAPLCRARARLRFGVLGLAVPALLHLLLFALALRAMWMVATGMAAGGVATAASRGRRPRPDAPFMRTSQGLTVAPPFRAPPLVPRLHPNDKES